MCTHVQTHTRIRSDNTVNCMGLCICRPIDLRPLVFPVGVYNGENDVNDVRKRARFGRKNLNVVIQFAIRSE